MSVYTGRETLSCASLPSILVATFASLYSRKLWWQNPFYRYDLVQYLCQFTDFIIQLELTLNRCMHKYIWKGVVHNNCDYIIVVLELRRLAVNLDVLLTFRLAKVLWSSQNISSLSTFHEMFLKISNVCAAYMVGGVVMVTWNWRYVSSTSLFILMTLVRKVYVLTHYQINSFSVGHF